MERLCGMKKHAEKIVVAVMLLLILVVTVLGICVNVKYGNKPISEIPAWAVRFFIKN